MIVIGQIALFDEIWDAHAINKNLFNKNLADPDIFKKYFDFACMVSSWDIEVNTRNYFLEEASMALVVFAENTEMDAERLEYIKSSRMHLSENREAIMAVRHLMADKLEKGRIRPNAMILAYPCILASISEILAVPVPGVDEAVDALTPPAFIFHTFEDKVVPVDNALAMVSAMHKAKIPFEMHFSRTEPTAYRWPSPSLPAECGL